MDNIILLAIFTYPGAVVDGVYTRLAKDKSFFAQPEAAVRAARDFFFSALIAVITMPIILSDSEGAHTLSNWVDVMKKDEVVWSYILSSALCAIVLGFAWYMVRRFPLLWLQNKVSAFSNIPTESPHSTIWGDILSTPEDIRLDRCAVIVRRNGEIVRAGLPYLLPHKIDQDPAIALMYCEHVEYELSLGSESTKVLDQQCVYYDIQNNVEIEFRNAGPLWDEMHEYAQTHTVISSPAPSASEPSASEPKA